MKFSTIPLLFCILLTSCARIADPKPPERRVPETVRDIEARQVGEEIVLTFSLPERNTDGSRALTIRSLEIFRVTDINEAQSLSALSDLSEDSFLERAAHAFSIPAARFTEYMRGNVFFIRDAPQITTEESINSLLFRYAAIFVNEKNQAAGLGRQAVIQPVVLPSAPEGLSSVVSENGIHITWTPVLEEAEAARPLQIAYNIYRSEKPEEFPTTPINDALLSEAEYRDGDFQFDKSYYYAVSVIVVSDTPAESVRSEILKVKTRDVFPPDPPGNFTAIAENDRVTLFWTPSPSVDVSGYRIFRRDKANARRSLSEGLITGISYRDESVETDGQYVYEIQAVDEHGNISEILESSVE